MKKESLFQEIPEDQREEMIAGIAFSTDHEKVKRPFNEDEKLQMKDFVVEESTSVMEQTAEFKAIKKEFDAAVKAHKEGISDALTKIKKGYSENEERIFFVDDQEEGLMHAYDKFGEFLYSRKLRPEEKQARIMLVKTGTDN